MTTTRTRVPYVVATVGDDLGLGQVCGCGDPGAGVGSVLTWTEHRVALLAQRFGPALYDKRLLGATRCSRYSLGFQPFSLSVGGEVRRKLLNPPAFSWWSFSGVPVPLDPLTSREREVLQCIAEGQTTKEIAACLGLSIKTAESHRINLMRKLDMHETASLVRYAIRRRLTTP